MQRNKIKVKKSSKGKGTIMLVLKYEICFFALHMGSILLISAINM